ncbi:MAG: hypothetical protein L0Y72_05035 [Gemmataceae bacterium]|nr:hypothetical protein [Gemmataceae bacterium]MCI0738387.1 hypothetical protein [Gemmataceae bacterium]
MKKIAFVSLLIAGLTALSLQAQVMHRSVQIEVPEEEKTYASGKFVANGMLVDINPQDVVGFVTHPDDETPVGAIGKTTLQPSNANMKKWEIEFTLDAKKNYKIQVDSSGNSGFFSAFVSPFHIEDKPLEKVVSKKPVLVFKKASLNESMQITQPNRPDPEINVMYQKNLVCKGKIEVIGQSVLGYIIPHETGPFAPLVGKTIDNGRNWEILFEKLDSLSVGDKGQGRYYWIIAKTTTGHHAARKKLTIVNEK